MREKLETVLQKGLIIKYKNKTVGPQNLGRQPREAPRPPAHVAPSQTRALTVSPRMPWTPLHCEGTDATPRVSSCSGPGRSGRSVLAAPPEASASAPALPAPQSCPGYARVTVETDPPPPTSAPAQSDATFAPAPPERKAGKVRLSAPFLNLSARLPPPSPPPSPLPPPPQDPRRRDKLFFSDGATSNTSSGFSKRRRSPLGACASTLGGEGSAEATRSCQVQRWRGAARRRGEGGGLWPRRAGVVGPRGAELAQLPSAPAELQLATTSKPSASRLILSFCHNRMAIFNIHMRIQCGCVVGRPK